MTDRNALYQLLFFALIELRESGHETGNIKALKIADLFHNLPLWLKDLDAGTATADDLLARLRERATELHVERWLDQHTPPRPQTPIAAAG